MENNIETQMAQYLNQSEQARRPSISPVIEKVVSLLDRFIAKYGSVQIGIFQLPDCPGEVLQRFLNSLQITLRRQMLPCSYVWQYVPSASCFHLLIFHCSLTYGRISDVVFRLWHSPPGPVQIQNIHADSFNLSSVKEMLAPLLIFETSMPIPYHRHSYGASFAV